MEYCGAGSVLDIMKLCAIYEKIPKIKTLDENQIATILSDTLKGNNLFCLNKITLQIELWFIFQLYIFLRKIEIGSSFKLNITT